MGLFDRASSPQRLQLPSIFVAFLLAIRFSYSTLLVAIRPSPELIATADEFFGTYETLLPFVLLPVVLLLGLSRKARARGPFALGLLTIHSTALVLWLVYLDPSSSQIAKILFPFVATMAVASSSLLSVALVGDWRRLMRRWEGWAYFGLLLLVPVVFVSRVAASLGAGTILGQAGEIRGNWFLVNVPTLSLQFLAISVWLSLVLDLDAQELRRRWRALLPFLAVPLSIVAFVLRPLSGYILSAFISWGSNLALFTPAPVSLGLAVTSIACYMSSFILLRDRGTREGWTLTLLSTGSVLLSGFYLSMASVEGLSLGLLLLAIALRRFRGIESSPVPLAAKHPTQ